MLDYRILCDYNISKEFQVFVGAAILLFISMLTCAAIGRATGERKGFALLGFFWVLGIIIAEAVAKRKFISHKKSKEK